MAGNSWPTPQDYNEAIQSPRACFSDPDLTGGTVDTNALGLPRAMTGAFASVYRINQGDKSWAVRCFLTSRLDQKDRYKHISDFVLFDDLNCTIDFHFIEQGIFVKNQWYPCLKMPWVTGDTLDIYLAKNYKTPGKIKQLHEDFHKLVDELECAGIGHGDMQHGNIIVTDRGLRLVDYDALYVPALIGRQSLELGHPNYQHPDRNEHHFDPDVDNFSCWLIHTSLLALAIDPQLYDQHNGGDESILFRRTDLADPEKSQLFHALLNHESLHIREATSLLRRMLWAAPLSIPILDCPPECLELLPHVKNEIQADFIPPPIESTPAIPQTNTAHRFDFIDDEASSVRVSAQQKARQTASQKLKNLDQARLKLAEDMLLFFAPTHWVHQHMALALRHFDDGHYDSALNTYLRVYKLTSKQTWTNDDSFFWCLMGLGYCSGLSDKTALAGNYFLLAAKSANTEKTKFRSALCLAVVRFESGDQNGAIKLLSDRWRVNSDLAETIDFEMHNVFVLRPSFFHLLRQFGERLLEQEDARSVEVLAAARRVFCELTKTNSLEISEAAALSLLKLAVIYRKRKDLEQARLIYREVGLSAIKYGVTTLGRASLFCSCLFNSTDANRSAGRLKDLEIIAQSLAQENNINSFCSRLDHMIVAQTEFAHESTAIALVELSRQFIKKQMRMQALYTAEKAFKFATENNLELNASLIGELGEEDGWTCLNDCFFGPNRNIGPLLNSLFASNDIATLKYIASRLADEGEAELLCDLILYCAFTFPSQFSEICTSWIVDFPGQSSARKTFFTALDNSGHLFVSNLELLFDEQPSDARTEENILEIQIEHLNAIAVVRAFLKTQGYENEAQFFSNIMMRMKNAQLIVVWMLKLFSEQESSRFMEFITDPIKSDRESVYAFALQLGVENTDDALEQYFGALRTWGVAEETLVDILLSAAKLCSERLNSLLNVEPIDQEVLLLLHAFYRMRAVAADLKLQHYFEEALKSLYEASYLEALSTLMKAVAATDDSDLLQTMALICNTLIENNHTPLVVSVALAAASASGNDFLDTLSLLIIRELPEKRVLEFASELIRREYYDGLAILIRSAKLMAKSQMLLKLLDKSSPSAGFAPMADVPTGQDEAFGAMVLLNNLSALADQVHLAALSGDVRLSNILFDLDGHGLTREQRKEVIGIVMSRCAESLNEYYERSLKGADPSGNLKILAVLNIAALHRLSTLMPHQIGTTSPASKILQSDISSDFVLNWMLDLAGGGEIDKLAEFAVETAQAGNISLLRSIFVKTARFGFLRALIVASRKVCATGFAPKLVLPIRDLADNQLIDAFGSVSLEVVTNSTCSNNTLLSIIEGLSAFDRNYLRIILRQIYFYRGKEAIDLLYSDWSNSAEHGSDSIVMLEEMRSLGYVS
ncbi:MAG: hypothetical protein SGJ27_30255 [Candidatus Melainabacteria bacterium]|nr:hypothetical protein [Candidatus Melainabacteria bacterium]